MVYIIETLLNDSGYIYLELQKVYGINKFKAYKICKKLGFSLNLKISDLTRRQINRLESFAYKSSGIITSKLKATRKQSLNTLIDVNTYKGRRLFKGFPARGQRTHSNARTARKKLYKFS